MSDRCNHNAIRGCCGFRGCIHYGKQTPPNPYRFDTSLNPAGDFVPRRYDHKGRLKRLGQPGHVRRAG